MPRNGDPVIAQDLGCLETTNTLSSTTTLLANKELMFEAWGLGVVIVEIQLLGCRHEDSNAVPGIGGCKDVVAFEDLWQLNMSNR